MAVEAAVATRRRLFTVEEFHKMGEVGVFAPDERVELIEGEIVEMSPIGDPHAGGTNAASYVLAGRLGGQAIVAVQNPIRLGDHSEPYPDVAVLRHRPDFYRNSTATTGDILLIVEVAVTTLRYDLRTKAPMYARYEIPEYWVEDVKGNRLIVHRDPSPTGYRTVQTLRRRDRVGLVAFPDVEIAVEELLG